MASTDVRTTIDNLAAEAGARLEAWGICKRPGAGLLLIVIACILLPLETYDIASMIVGVLAYMLLQTLQPKVDDSMQERRPAKVLPSRRGHGAGTWRSAGGAAEQRGIATGSASHTQKPRALPVALESQVPEVRQVSVVPITAPTFESAGFDAEVQELLSRIAPTPRGDATVECIARSIQQVVAPILPEAEITGFVGGNIAGGTAFGVAVPEVDIVISVNPMVLFRRLQSRWIKSQPAGSRLVEQKLQKSAIRACTDRLVSTGAFKFRRSAFRGSEPKVTIIALANRPCGQGVPLNLSVNAVTPFHNATLMAECGRLDPQAWELVLLVKRWAKDRGLCHSAKGHLSPYIWTILVIFFCQVKDTDEGPLLPPLEGLATCPSHLRAAAGRVTPPASGQLTPAREFKLTTGSLLRDFMVFYTLKFDWGGEAVSIRRGKRGAPNPSLPLHVVVSLGNGGTEIGPSIEDPFDPTRNLGDCTTALSLAHLHGELQRARELCNDGASLSELLQPWAPPEAAEEQEEEQ